MTKTLEKVEIFDVGLWNGMEFTLEDLKMISNAFDTLGDNHQVPLKMGHNEEQPMTDGQPALGMVEKVWVEGSKLMAKFINVPEIVFDAVTAKLYSNVSIELDMGVEYKSDFYPLVLSGVALLGADIPAVNTLENLSAFMTRNKDFSFKDKKVFTCSKNNLEDKTMPKTAREIELEALLEVANTANGTLSKDNEKLAGDNATFSKENKLLNDSKKSSEETAKKASFAAAKTSITDDLDSLVKEKKITPAQRESMLNDFKEDDGVIGTLKYSIEAFKKLEPNNQLPSNGGRGGEGEEGRADEIVVQRTQKLMRESSTKLSFSAAKAKVLSGDKQLAKDYANMNGYAGGAA